MDWFARYNPTYLVWIGCFPALLLASSYLSHCLLLHALPLSLASLSLPAPCLLDVCSVFLILVRANDDVEDMFADNYMRLLFNVMVC